MDKWILLTAGKSTLREFVYENTTGHGAQALSVRMLKYRNVRCSDV